MSRFTGGVGLEAQTSGIDGLGEQKGGEPGASATADEPR